MRRYGNYCTRGRTPTCQDYARIHNGGPAGCRQHSNSRTEARLQRYWARVQSCCNRNGGCWEEGFLSPGDACLRYLFEYATCILYIAAVDFFLACFHDGIFLAIGVKYGVRMLSAWWFHWISLFKTEHLLEWNLVFRLMITGFFFFIVFLE